MNALTPFDFEGRAVRVVEDEAGMPWFVARDVCDALGISNHSHAVSRLDDDEKGVANSDTLGGTQQVGTVNEAGLYSLTLTSRKPEAKRFKRWITHEVLPALRRTGRYVLPEAEAEPPALPAAPAHRSDYLVAANRSFAALLRAGRLFGLGQRVAARRANAATEALTGVNLAELLGAESLIDEPEPAPLSDPGAREREYLRAWLEGRDEVTNDDVVDALGLPRDRASYMRAAFSMHRLGWTKTRMLQPDGSRATRYRRPGFNASNTEGAA